MATALLTGGAVALLVCLAVYGITALGDMAAPNDGILLSAPGKLLSELLTAATFVSGLPAIAASLSGLLAVAAAAIKNEAGGTDASLQSYAARGFFSSVTFEAVTKPLRLLPLLLRDKAERKSGWNTFKKEYALFTVVCFGVTHIPNFWMVRLLDSFTLIKTSEKQTRDNLSANIRILEKVQTEKTGFFSPSNFVENQSEWEKVRFGHSTMRYSGCEIMAAYNALLDLGEEMTARDMAELIAAFERSGAELKGYWGCSPLSLYRFFAGQGYRVIISTATNPETINSIGENSDSVIITAYNDRYDIRRMIHTISITKGKDGGYILHNAYKRIRGRYAAYSGRDDSSRGGRPFQTLQEVIAVMSQGPAAPICIIGISRKQAVTSQRSPD